MSSLTVEEALERVTTVPEAISALWDLDINRLVPNKDYTIDLQDRAKRSSRDYADEPLFSSFSDDVWKRPTYGSFKKLLDNYIAEAGIPEKVSKDEQEEENKFLNLICETPCMQFVFQYLCKHSSMTEKTMDEFKQLLDRIWFKLQKHKADRDSSGFEHVFCGELLEDEASGMHNYIQIYNEEKRGNFNYRGFVKLKGATSDTPPPEMQLAKIRFEWFGKMKRISGMFIGVSPEFEFALYTLMYVTDNSRLEATFGPYTASIRTYKFDVNLLATAYPDLMEVDPEKLEQLYKEPRTEVCVGSEPVVVSLDGN